MSTKKNGKVENVKAAEAKVEAVVVAPVVATEVPDVTKEQPVLKNFVDQYNAGATKSKLIIVLNKEGLTNQEIVSTFQKFGVKMSYNHVYNVLSKVEGVIMHTSANHTAAGASLDGLNKSEFIKKLAAEGKTRGEIAEAFKAKGVMINKTMIYGVLRKEGLITPQIEERVPLQLIVE